MLPGLAEDQGLSLLIQGKMGAGFGEGTVTDADLEAILSAGANAPSAMNLQPWHFSAVTSKDVLTQIQEGMMPDGVSIRPCTPSTAARPPVQGTSDDRNAQAPQQSGTNSGQEGQTLPAGGSTVQEGSSGSIQRIGLTGASVAIVVSGVDTDSSGQDVSFDCGLTCENMAIAAGLLGYNTRIIASPVTALNRDRQGEYRSLLGIPEGMNAIAMLLIGPKDAASGASTRNELEDVVTYVK